MTQDTSSGIRAKGLYPAFEVDAKRRRTGRYGLAIVTGWPKPNVAMGIYWPVYPPTVKP